MTAVTVPDTAPALAGSVPRSGHLPALDGLRAVAVVLVVLFHSGLGLARNGFVGVDVFFVLSGFLITRLLLEELALTSTLRLRTFYARRIRRLLPAAMVVAAGVVAIALVIDPVARRLSLVGDAQASSLYVANWHFLLTSREYFGPAVDVSPFLHFWSLAIEEQFYVLYPLVLMVVWKLARRRVGALIAMLTGLAVAGAVVQVVVGASDPTRAYFGTDTRAYQLLAGAVLAAFLRLHVPSTRTAARRALGTDLAAAVLVAALVVLALPVATLDVWARGLMATVVAVGLVATCARGTSRAVRLAGHGIPAYVGRLSYGIYLWHWPLIVALREVWSLSPLVVAVLALATSLPLAALSHHLLERPVRRSMRLDRRPIAVVGAGVIVSIAVAVAAGESLAAPWRPLVTRVHTTASGVRVDVSDDIRLDVGAIDWESLDPRLAERGTGHPTCTQFDLPACDLVGGDGPRWLLVGDSHAQTLLPAITEYARSRGIHLVQSVELGCGWEHGVRNLAVPGRKDGCLLLRSDYPHWLVEADQIDVVIAVGVLRAGDDFGEDRRYMFADAALRALPYDEALRRIRTSTVEALRSVGAAVIVLEPTPIAPFNPLECLSASGRVGDCAWVDARPSTSIDTAVRALDEPGSGVASVDVDDLACPRLPTCLPYVDGEFTYSDEHHLRPEWWLAHLDELSRRLDAAAASVGEPISAGEG